jgi:hypothetical protein
MKKEDIIIGLLLVVVIALGYAIGLLYQLLGRG